MVYLAVVLLHQSEGTSSFNRNGALLRAFNGDNPDNNNRDTEGKFTIFLYILYIY